MASVQERVKAGQACGRDDNRDRDVARGGIRVAIIQKGEVFWGTIDYAVLAAVRFCSQLKCMESQE